MDCDGVLTDGTVYYSANGEELLRFHRRDGHGIKLLHKENIKTAIISSEKSEIINRRAEKMRIGYVSIGIKNKAEVLVELINNLKIKNENVAYIGDDVNDLDAMNQVGVRVAVCDAVKEICSIADYICANKGGEAAVREFIDLLLRIRKEQGSEA
jgi:3-deoxy-D-manno-octulosonate 8-phosphate phosphatase (KDO 8-P phosphatase)